MSTVVPRPCTTHPGNRWGPALGRVAVAGTAEASGRLRVWAARQLMACPRPYRTDRDLRERLELVVSELGANAVRHSASGRDGGFMIAVLFALYDRIAFRLYDEGPRPDRPSTPVPPPPRLDDIDLFAEERGRGLALVAVSASAYGFTAPPANPAHSVWVELAPSPLPAAAAAGAGRWSR